MNLPPEFISTIQNTFREDGYAFLEGLPGSIVEASAKWSLADVEPAPTLSYNFVAFARKLSSPSGRRPGGEGMDVVLKMGVPNREFLSEMAALRLFHGEGACRLIDSDTERYWMLLERLVPGEMLAEVKDDEQATRIAAEVMKRIWKPVDSAGLAGAPAPGLEGFIRLADWFEGLERLRQKFDGGTGPLDEKLVQHVESSVRDFFVENHRPVLMHGDFHHYNILSSGRGWLIIDPKGVIGPAGYEVGPLLTNPWGELIHRSDLRRITRRRIEILHEHLGFEQERLREWGLAHSILSAWWGLEDNTGWEFALACARMMSDLE